MERGRTFQVFVRASVSLRLEKATKDLFPYGASAHGPGKEAKRRTLNLRLRIEGIEDWGWDEESQAGGNEI